MKPIKPVTAFDFNAAAGGIFQTLGGKEFALRLWFWMSAAMSVVFLITLPFMLKNYGNLIEQSWLSNKALLGGGPPPPPDQMFSAFLPVIPGMLAYLFGAWIVVAAGETAFYRHYFHNEEKSRQPLRFGKEEFRTMICQLGVWGSVFGAYFFGLLAIMIVAGIFGIILPILAVIVGVLGVIAIIALFILIPIRLAPAAALSMDNDRTHVFAARHVTKYRFWNLFVAYLVTYIGGYILYYLIYVLSVGIATGDIGFLVAMSGFGDENPRLLFETAAERFKNPLFMFLGIVAMIINAAVMCAWVLLVAGVNAYAVRWWKEDNPISKFE